MHWPDLLNEPLWIHCCVAIFSALYYSGAIENLQNDHIKLAVHKEQTSDLFMCHTTIYSRNVPPDKQQQRRLSFWSTCTSKLQRNTMIWAKVIYNIIW